jgi:hypothetical protein
MNNLERAIQIATEAHAGQVDKAGAPYILHPLRVMLALQGEAAQIAGVLHDVAEDCPAWPQFRLAEEAFPNESLVAIAILTKREGDHYADYLMRVGTNELAKQVKIADLKDNLDVTRIGELSERDLKRLNKYKDALAYLEQL